MTSRHANKGFQLARNFGWSRRRGIDFISRRSSNARLEYSSQSGPAREQLTSIRSSYKIPVFLTFALAFSAASFYLGSKKLPVNHATSTTPLSQARRFEHNVTSSNLKAAYDECSSIIGKENVSAQESDLSGHSGSEWSSYTTKVTDRSSLIVYPANTDEVAAIMKVCHQRSIPVTPFSGGTSLEGNFAPTRGGICIDFGRMNKIVAIHPRDLDVVVQPGVGWEELNEELAEQSLFFPPDPGPGAKIGGMIGTGCSGTNAYRYGTMREWVLSLTVVLADGTVIKTRQRPRKSSAGYDLTKLIIGSEGTLGLVTEATLKITILPRNQRVAVASFNSVHDAAECVAQVVGAGVALSGIEILDDVQMRCINQSKATTRNWQEKPTLFFKFAGTLLGVKEQISIVQQAASQHKSQSFEFAHSEDEALELWSARKEALWSVIAMKRHPEDHVWTTDVAVPISRLPDIIMQTKEDIKNSGLLGTIVGHVGDGNFHAFLLFNDSQRQIAEDLIHRMVDRAIEMEGTVTGEHGIGLIKRDYLDNELGKETVDMMRKLKEALDPLCLLNCDKVVRMEK